MNRPLRILIVEHDHAMRHGLSLHLELDGCACYSVPNVTSAIHRDDLGSFDLVVCGLTAGLFEAQHIIEAVRRASGATYVPILMIATNATRVLVLRVATELLEPFGDTPVPFTELVSLGGADSLRGFPAGRFRDHSSLMFTAEYRWAVWLAADAALFADWGGVFDRHFGAFAIDRMVPDVGVGLRIRTQSSFLVRLQLAYGFGEGVQLVVATNTGL